MGTSPRAWISRRFSCHFLCLASLFLVKGWGRMVDVPAASAEGKLGPPNIQDPGSSQKRVTGYHPKSPPPPRIEDIPPNSIWFVLEFDQGLWSLTLDKNMSNSEVRALVRNISEKIGGSPPGIPAKFSSKIIANKCGYERTTWWFETGLAADVFETFLADLATSAAERPVNALEIGTFEGGSALWIAEHLLLHPDSILICIDLWNGGPDLEPLGHIDASGSEARFHHNMAKAPNHERVVALKGDSLLSLSEIVAAGGTSSFDVIYVDGDHAMQAVLADVILSFRLLKVGGFLIADDMKLFPEVEHAMAAVVEAFGGEGRLEVLHNENQMVIRKTAEDRWITAESVVTMGDLEGNPLLSNFVAAPQMASAW